VRWEFAFAKEFGWTWDQVMGLPLGSFDRHAERFEQLAKQRPESGGVL
jgi:hypothetical protein